MQLSCFTGAAAPGSPDLAFTNQRYMEMPPTLPNIDIAADNAANDMRASENSKLSPKSKFLDEYGTYTEDGYMAPKHLYADVGDVPRRSQIPAIPQHYDVVKSPSSEMPASSSVPNLYEDPRSIRLDSSLSPSHCNIPANVNGATHYDIPRTSAVASEYSSTAELTGQAPADNLASARSSMSDNELPTTMEGLYDKPRFNLSDFESKETCT